MPVKPFPIYNVAWKPHKVVAKRTEWYVIITEACRRLNIANTQIYSHNARGGYTCESVHPFRVINDDTAWYLYYNIERCETKEQLMNKSLMGRAWIFWQGFCNKYIAGWNVLSVPTRRHTRSIQPNLAGSHLQLGCQQHEQLPSSSSPPC